MMRHSVRAVLAPLPTCASISSGCKSGDTIRVPPGAVGGAPHETVLALNARRPYRAQQSVEPGTGMVSPIAAQETRFANGRGVIVNFSQDRPFEGDRGAVPPKGFLVFED